MHVALSCAIALHDMPVLQYYKSEFQAVVCPGAVAVDVVRSLPVPHLHVRVPDVRDR